MFVDHESIESARFRCAKQPDGERSADASTLPDVRHDESHLGAVIDTGDHVTESDDVAAVALVQFRDQRQSTQAVDVGQDAQKRLREGVNG
jgi:hypothetical protein